MSVNNNHDIDFVVSPGSGTRFLHDHIELSIVKHGLEDGLQPHCTDKRRDVGGNFAAERQTKELGDRLVDCVRDIGRLREERGDYEKGLMRG